MEKTVKIHVENLKKDFGSLEVLKDINIDVYEGEVIVVIGPSGSGKSTFLRCLNKLENSTAGKIIINNTDINDKHENINKIRENIGMVFQHFNLFPNMTVIENIMLAPVKLKKMTKEEARTGHEAFDTRRTGIKSRSLSPAAFGRTKTKGCNCKSIGYEPFHYAF